MAGRGMIGRVTALESARGGSDWSDILDRMPGCDLERLEGIFSGFGSAGVTEGAIEALPDTDASFLVSILAMKEGLPCQVVG